MLLSITPVYCIYYYQIARKSRKILLPASRTINLGLNSPPPLQPSSTHHLFLPTSSTTTTIITMLCFCPQFIHPATCAGLLSLIGGGLWGLSGNNRALATAESVWLSTTTSPAVQFCSPTIPPFPSYPSCSIYSSPLPTTLTVTTTVTATANHTPLPPADPPACPISATATTTVCKPFLT